MDKLIGSHKHNEEETTLYYLFSARSRSSLWHTTQRGSASTEGKYLDMHGDFSFHHTLVAEISQGRDVNRYFSCRLGKNSQQETMATTDYCRFTLTRHKHTHLNTHKIFFKFFWDFEKCSLRVRVARGNLFCCNPRCVQCV